MKPPRAISVDRSYRHCARVARRSASNFYWSFWFLPAAKRRAMCALYAFSRHTDDLADNDQPLAVRRESLTAWRGAVEKSFRGEFEDELLPALVDAAERYGIPRRHLLDVIDGVEMDLQPRRYATFDQLRVYCHHVASAVGLACIHIWGFDGDQVRQPAENCGLAFQLTNILRDLAEDAQRDRIYLPLEDLDRFHYRPEELKQAVRDERFVGLMRFQIERAEGFYQGALPLLDYLHHDGRRTLRVMLAVYHRILTEIKHRDGDVFSRRVRLSLPTKLSVATRSLLAHDQLVL